MVQLVIKTVPGSIEKVLWQEWGTLELKSGKTISLQVECEQKQIYLLFVVKLVLQGNPRTLLEED